MSKKITLRFVCKTSRDQTQQIGENDCAVVGRSCQVSAQRSPQRSRHSRNRNSPLERGMSPYEDEEESIQEMFVSTQRVNDSQQMILKQDFVGKNHYQQVSTTSSFQKQYLEKLVARCAEKESVDYQSQNTQGLMQNETLFSSIALRGKRNSKTRKNQVFEFGSLGTLSADTSPIRPFSVRVKSGHNLRSEIVAAATQQSIENENNSKGMFLKNQKGSSVVMIVSQAGIFRKQSNSTNSHSQASLNDRRREINSRYKFGRVYSQFQGAQSTQFKLNEIASDIKPENTRYTTEELERKYQSIVRRKSIQSIARIMRKVKANMQHKFVSKSLTQRGSLQQQQQQQQQQQYSQPEIGKNIDYYYIDQVSQTDPIVNLGAISQAREKLYPKMIFDRVAKYTPRLKQRINYSPEKEQTSARASNRTQYASLTRLSNDHQGTITEQKNLAQKSRHFPQEEILENKASMLLYTNDVYDVQYQQTPFMHRKASIQEYAKKKILESNIVAKQLKKQMSLLMKEAAIAARRTSQILHSEGQADNNKIQ